MKRLSFTARAVLFDLDGVLIDSSIPLRRRWTQWAQKHDLDARRVWREGQGRRTIDTIRYWFPDWEEDQLVAEAVQMQQFDETDLDDVAVYAGAKELLHCLYPAFAVVTSGARHRATASLQHVGLPVPEALICAESVSKGKPHPEGLLKAASALAVLPEQCVMVGDAPADVEAAKAAGMKSIAVGTTHSLHRLHADMLLYTLQQLQIAASDDHFLITRSSN